MRGVASLILNMYWTAAHPVVHPAACAAREKFKTSHQPLESAVWFLAMGKKSLVQSLCKGIGDAKLSAFFAYVPHESVLPLPELRLLFCVPIVIS